MTIDDLATMVAKGFEQTATKQDLLNLVTKNDFKKEMQALKDEMQALRNTVNNHLELSDKRYLELKQRSRILAKFLKLVIQKSKIDLDPSELEHFDS
ncbi:MAG: hypothetical protein HY395_01390 [Candidatus Doudnabacteria bacterium]|nr:hypothetical protein [Candidatus Doudnabacteria bacterium]